MVKNRKHYGIIPYAIISLGLLLLVVYLYRLWNWDLTKPLNYEWDTVLNYSIAHSGFSSNISNIGAPFGTLVGAGLPAAEWLSIALIKLIGAPFQNDIVGHNILYILSYPIIGITTYYALRKYKVSTPFAVLGAFAYAFAPYHLYRGMDHFFLSMYYLLPLFLVVIKYKFIDGNGSVLFKNFKTQRKENIFTLLVLVGMGINGVYYAFFSCFFLMIVGIYFSIINKKKTDFINSMVMVAIIAGALIVNFAPVFIYKATSYPQFYAGNERSLMEPEQNAFKIILALLPASYSRLPQIFTEKYYTSSITLGESGLFPTALGLLASIGFVILLVLIVFQIKIPHAKKEIKTLKTLNVAGILLATVGGISSIFALVVSSQIRCYGRIVIFLGLFSLFCLFILVDAYTEKHSKIRNLAVLLIAFLFLFDQVPGRHSEFRTELSKTTESAQNEYTERDEYLSVLEDNFNEGDSVFQLPYVPFPENPPMNDLMDYEHIKPALICKKLNWSYGAAKSRFEGQWNQYTAQLGIKQMLDRLLQADFQAIYIDRLGYADRGQEIEQKLRIFLEEPIVSENNRWATYDLRTYQNAQRDAGKKAAEKCDSDAMSPVVPLFVEGFLASYQQLDSYHFVGSADCTIDLVNYTDEEMDVVVQFAIQSHAATDEVQGYMLYDDQKSEWVAGEEPKQIELQITLAKGINKLQFITQTQSAGENEAKLNIYDLNMKAKDVH